MKRIFKVLNIIIFIIFGLVSLSKAENFEQLFGLKLSDNIEQHFNLAVVNQEKYKNPETIENYFDVDVTNLIKNKSPQIDYYTITFDNNNILHSIYGEKQLDTVENCTERVVPSIIDIFDRKYSLSFEYYESSYTEFNIYSYYSYDENGNPLRIQCNEGTDGLIFLQIVYQTNILLDEVDKFYDSGF